MILIAGPDLCCEAAIAAATADASLFLENMAYAPFFRKKSGHRICNFIYIIKMNNNNIIAIMILMCLFTIPKSTSSIIQN